MAEITRVRRHQEPAGLSAALDPFRDFQGGSIELFLAKIAYSIRTNVKRTLLVLLAIILLFVGAGVFMAWHDYRAKQSLEAFETLMKNPVMSPEAGTTQTALKKLDEYTKNWGDRGAENRANLSRLSYLEKAGLYGQAGDVSVRLADSMGDSQIQIYFELRAATYYEMAGNLPMASKYYRIVYDSVPEPGILKALAAFGEGRSLLTQRKEKEGKEFLHIMMKMEGPQNMDDLRLSAASFLLSRTGK